MSEITPTLPDYWIEREPERFEDRLFVSEETHSDGLLEGVAREHIAVYTDELTIEYYNDGEWNFYNCETAAEVTDRVDALMRF